MSIKDIRGVGPKIKKAYEKHCEEERKAGANLGCFFRRVEVARDCRGSLIYQVHGRVEKGECAGLEEFIGTILINLHRFNHPIYLHNGFLNNRSVRKLSKTNYDLARQAEEVHNKMLEYRWGTG